EVVSEEATANDEVAASEEKTEEKTDEKTEEAVEAVESEEEASEEAPAAAEEKTESTKAAKEENAKADSSAKEVSKASPNKSTKEKSKEKAGTESYALVPDPTVDYETKLDESPGSGTPVDLHYRFTAYKNDVDKVAVFVYDPVTKEYLDSCVIVPGTGNNILGQLHKTFEKNWYVEIVVFWKDGPITAYSTDGQSSADGGRFNLFGEAFGLPPIPPGSLEFSKTVEGVKTGDVEGGTFNYVLIDSENKVVKEFSLQPNGTLNQDLDEGEYTIIELDPSKVYEGYGYDFGGVTASGINEEKLNEGTLLEKYTGYYGTVNINSKETSTVSFTNNYGIPVGSIVVAKEVRGVENDEIAGKTFTFTLCDEDGEPVEGVDPQTITMSADADKNVVTFENLPAGGTYTIREGNPSDVYQGYSITSVAVGEQVLTESSDHSYLSGKVVVSKDEDNNLTFTNTYGENASDITVTKKVKGVHEGDVESGQFTFTLVDSDGEKVGDSQTVDLSKTPSITFEGVAPGKYTIVESNPYEYDGYTFQNVTVDGTELEGDTETGYTFDGVTVSKGQAEPSEVTFTNTYSENSGSITVTKEVKGVHEGDVESGQFTFT
ncbi:MAG: DUF5979 domain-containing protein, partial [Lysinibacillus sp.]